MPLCVYFMKSCKQKLLMWLSLWNENKNTGPVCKKIHCLKFCLFFLSRFLPGSVFLCNTRAVCKLLNLDPDHPIYITNHATGEAFIVEPGDLLPIEVRTQAGQYEFAGERRGGISRSTSQNALSTTQSTPQADMPQTQDRDRPDTPRMSWDTPQQSPIPGGSTEPWGSPQRFVGSVSRDMPRITPYSRPRSAGREQPPPGRRVRRATATAREHVQPPGTIRWVLTVKY